MAEVGGAGAIADDHTGHAGFDGNSGLDGLNILRYENDFGGLQIGASFEQEGADGGGDIVGAGIKGGLGDISLGVGFQSNDGSNIAGASVSAGFGDISGVFNYSRKTVDGGDDTTHLGVGATYTVGNTAVNVNFGQKETGDMDATGFGVAAQYDLGGGAKVQFGYGNSEDADDSWSFGLKMAF